MHLGGSPDTRSLQNEVLLSELGVSPWQFLNLCFTLKHPSVGLVDTLLSSVFRFVWLPREAGWFHLVTALSGVICRELDPFQGRPLTLARSKNRSQAVHHQEEEVMENHSPSRLRLTFPRACLCPADGTTKWKSHETLLVSRLLYFSRIVRKIRNSTLKSQAWMMLADSSWGVWMRTDLTMSF